MDIRQLQYFVTVVQEKTVTAAAKQLNMTQPPLTAQLHSLEEELDCQLFRREGRRLHLTEAGRHLYSRASQILGMCETVKQEISDFRDGSAGTLRIGVVSSVQGTIFIKMISAFHNQYPGVRLSIHSANTYELLDMIHHRQIDLALVRTPFPTLGLEVLYQDEEQILALGLEKYFEHSDGDCISLKELAGMPLIIYRRWQKVIEASFEASGLKPDIFCVNDDANMTLMLALRGLGVGILHPSALDRPPAVTVIVRRVREKALVSQIALVRQNNIQLPKTARLFWEMARKKQKEVPLNSISDN